MKKTILLIIFFCTILIQRGVSQDNFYKSSIITLKNDTIQGYISNLYDSKSVKFKQSLRGKSVIYAPHQIKGFNLDGNIFESRQVRLNRYKYENFTGDASSFLTIDWSKGQILDTVFLQKIIKGKVNLYRMKYIDNTLYLFTESDGVIREIPQQYFVVVRDSMSKGRFVQMRNQTLTLNSTAYEFRSYMDTLMLVFDNPEYNKNIKPFRYSEKMVKVTIADYNRKMGIRSGGFIKSTIPNKYFLGGAIGRMLSIKDDVFDYQKATTSLAGKIYCLMPLVGMNRNVSAKVGINYFTYSNSSDKKDIWSAAFGLRYSALSGWVRPYGEFSLAVSKQYWNRGTHSMIFPSILEAGVLIPVNRSFLNSWS